MSDERHEVGTGAEGAPPPDQDRTERERETRRGHPRGRGARLYAEAVIAVVLIGVLIAWVIANRGSVQVDWLLGTTDAALALVIFIAAVLGWIIGIATAVAIRRRARTGGRDPH